MKVLLDDQVFTNQDYGGISRYFAKLIEHRDADLKYDVCVKRSNNEHLQSVLAHKRPFFYRSANSKLIGFGRTLAGRSNRAYSEKKLKTGSYDLFHPTYFNPYFIDLINKPYVITVYDMIHERFPDYFPNDPTATQKKLVCEKADRIIAISESTRNDILEYYNIPEDKVEVIHLAGALDPDDRTREEMDLPESYILFVGNRDMYKNFKCLYMAALPILKENPSMHIVCTGRDFSEMERSIFQKDGVDNQLINRYAGDSDMYGLYKYAKVFVFPSLYEGFGIPVLEAFSAGCVTILSDSSSLPEIGGDAALYFDGHSPEDLFQCLKQVLEDSKLKSGLIDKGYRQLSNFSWDKTARETFSFYQSI